MTNDLTLIKRDSPFVFKLLKNQYRIAKRKMPVGVLPKDWYSDTWTKKQSETYMNWFISCLMKNKSEARKVFYFYGSKRDAERCWHMWNFQYGFKEAG